SLAWYPHPNVRWVAEYSRVDTTNLMFMRDEAGLQMLMPVMAGDTDLEQNTVVLMLEVDF
ncbi:MAG TPA: hypothetical protein VLB09_04390, partial [Nitrospiria bacterium]|nr:hypothetical protein [Nitrospiria bacterium]